MVARNNKPETGASYHIESGKEVVALHDYLSKNGFLTVDGRAEVWDGTDWCGSIVTRCPYPGDVYHEFSVFSPISRLA